MYSANNALGAADPLTVELAMECSIPRWCCSSTFLSRDSPSFIYVGPAQSLLGMGSGDETTIVSRNYAPLLCMGKTGGAGGLCVGL